MRFRQVHLDFHTSEAIPGIGSSFDKQQFQSMLKLGHVDSITVFSKCHHGWAYHPSEANEMHPHLEFDLLGSMIEAAHEIGVKTPVYLSAGHDEKLARRYTQWLIRDKNERTNWAPDFMHPSYHQFCMNTPYLDILVAQIEEVVQRYDVDGIFLDIVGVRQCYCQNCVADIRAEGKDPRDGDAMKALWERTYQNYATRTVEAAHKHKPGLPFFHNGGHIRRGRRDLAGYNTHLELESLPTGGWGYDHFPLSARYAQTLDMPYLGMTGKFHTSWGEFGGYKHPNALLYETALSLANGARCSVGDQLHPEGKMDEATYTLIGKAYKEVERKELWCGDVQSVADVALLTLEAIDPYGLEDTSHRSAESDAGAVRMLLEGKLLFDVVDTEADFAKYKVLILPDYVAVNASLQTKLDAFTAGGGKLFVSGRSGVDVDHGKLTLDVGARWVCKDPYRPSYFRPEFPVLELPNASYIMYSEGQQIEAADGATVLGYRQNSYFNRDVFTFCSHQHTPGTLKDAGPAMTEGPDGIYFAWNVFEDYATKASIILRQVVLYALKRLLGTPTVVTNLPAQGIVTVQSQEREQRWVNHLLYATPIRRGNGVEIIEDLVPLYDIDVEVRVPREVRQVYLAPSMEELPYEQSDGAVRYTVPKLHTHEMVVLQF